MKNWCYRAYEPTKNLERVNEQLRLAHIYRNKLCELELQRREEVEACWRECCPEYMVAKDMMAMKQAKLDELFASIRKRAQANRTKAAPIGEERALIQKLKVEMKTSRQEVKALLATAKQRPDVVQRLMELSEAHKRRYRAARASSGLFWGTYLFVEDSCKDFGRGAPPQYRRWNGTGTIACQVQYGLPVDELLQGQDTRVRLHISAACEEALATQGKAHGKRARSYVEMRIGSEGRAPIFATIPIQMHRPLPAGAKIKWCYLEKRRVASQEQWTVRLSIDEPPRIRATCEELCCVHVGWRVMEDGSLRVATWRGSDGQQGQVMIAPERIARLCYCDELRSVRDHNTNMHRTMLIEWLKSHEHPEWLGERTATIGQWRSPARMAALVLAWREQRFASDEQIYVPLEAWRKQDKHLWTWQEHQRRNCVCWRNNEYRNVAKTLAARYGHICIMDCEWAEMRKKPAIGEEEKQTTAMRFNSSLAAVATLERYLREAFGTDCELHIDTAGVTRQCHACGANNEDIGVTRMVTCCGCGREIDIDLNALDNMVARAKVVHATQPPLASIMTQRVKAHGNSRPLSKRQAGFRAARKRPRNQNPDNSL